MNIFDQFRQNVTRTTPVDNRNELISNAIMGITGETGEVVEIIKKWRYHCYNLDIDKLKEEIGDVMWYYGLLMNVLDIRLEDVLIMNMDKLQKRYPNGFTTSRRESTRL